MLDDSNIDELHAGNRVGLAGPSWLATDPAYIAFFGSKSRGLTFGPAARRPGQGHARPGWVLI